MRRSVVRGSPGVYESELNAFYSCGYWAKSACKNARYSVTTDSGDRITAPVPSPQSQPKNWLLTVTGTLAMK
jgi:hypothetical protein